MADTHNQTTETGRESDINQIAATLAKFEQKSPEFTVEGLKAFAKQMPQDIDEQAEFDEEEERLRIDALPVVEQFMHYFDQEETVIIGFNYRYEENIVSILKTFVVAHPEFAPLTQPILDYDPQYASAGEIEFSKTPDGKVKSELVLRPGYVSHEEKEQHIMGEWTREQLQRFVELTETFGHFAVDGQGMGLNY
jgi:hypothetical protein